MWGMWGVWATGVCKSPICAKAQYKQFASTGLLRVLGCNNRVRVVFVVFAFKMCEKNVYCLYRYEPFTKNNFSCFYIGYFTYHVYSQICSCRRQHCRASNFNSQNVAENNPVHTIWDFTVGGPDHAIYWVHCTFPKRHLKLNQ